MEVRELHDDGREVVSEGLQVDRSSNIRLTFQADRDPHLIPTTGYRPLRTSKSQSTGELLVGPAWINGRWQAVVRYDAGVPWIGYLAKAIEDDRSNSDRSLQAYSALTLDGDLQRAAMNFVSRKGRNRHEQLLYQDYHRKDPIKALPPRVALSVIALPRGEVLALGTWPHMTSGQGWSQTPFGPAPPMAWLDTKAPGPIAYRYRGDHNFALIEMGSASKPIWAAAVLRATPHLAQQLRTRGPAGREQSVFGIQLVREVGDGWTVQSTPDWIDFLTYLRISDNRYHVRLGFLGIADANKGVFLADKSAGASKSDVESLSAKNQQPIPWRQFPLFRPEVGFSASYPRQIRSLNQTPLATNLREMFGISVQRADMRYYRRSFWSLDEASDQPEAASANEWDWLLNISPTIARFSLDTVLHPRDYVSLLLGGGNNRWSNVEFAAAFATTVTGHPVIAHGVAGEVRGERVRRDFSTTAAQLRPGLAGVMGQAGTAYKVLQQSNPQLLKWLQSLTGVKVYAKTGTLSTDGGTTNTSRLVLALIRWKDETRGQVERGLVLSLVAERATEGSATRWLGEFLAENHERLETSLGVESVISPSLERVPRKSRVEQRQQPKSSKGTRRSVKSSGSRN